MTTVLDAFAQRRRRGATVLEGLATAAAEVDASAASTSLSELAERARSGRFVVLLLGTFSSGKSTLLNALLGRPSLPVKVNPCTAILTEVIHGPEPEVTVRYTDGRARTLNVPSFLEEFQLRTASEDEAGAEATDRFGDVDRAVLAYPLPLLENGVVLLDTPGLDDDEIRTTRTLSSLPGADAVIVVLNATRFLTELERRTLQRSLAPLGLTNLFFPMTMVDLLEALSSRPAEELASIRERAREMLGPFCTVDGQDRFSERFFPLDARTALASQWDRTQEEPRVPIDETALSRSGLPPFENALEHFLIRERGQAQLRHLVTTAQRVHRDLHRAHDLDKATASASADELAARQAELEPRFQELAVIADRVGRTTDKFIERQQYLIYQDLRDFLIRTEEALPDAVADFDLGNLATLDLLTPRGRARVDAELRAALEAWLDSRVAAWQKQLRPRLEAALSDLQKEITGDAADFDHLTRTIVTDFAGGTFVVPSADRDDPDVDPAERWFSVALGAVLLSPGAMAAGWTEGYEGALKGAASRLGVRLALLTIGALLGPVGWVGLLFYVVSDAVLIGVTGGSQLQRLRTQVAETLQGKLVQQAEEAKEDIFARVAEGLSPLRTGLVGAANQEAAELRATLDETIAARQQAAIDAAERGKRWASVLSEMERGIAELESLADVTALAATERDS